ncbi:MAG: glycosyltransferase family 39 protein, partial [Ramlibacter sp.]
MSIVLLATAWIRPLMLPDEGRYVGVAWEMMRSGNWLVPTLDGLPFFHKPPLFYWLTAASMSAFGLHEWAARMASVSGAVLGSFALWLFLRRWWSERSANLAAVALLSQPLFLLGGQFANLDMLVAGCITVTIVLAADAALCITGDRPYRGALAGAWAMAALGVLAKGLIGVVIPGGVIVVWLLALRRWRVIGRLLWWPGCLLFMVIAVPWFWAMQVRFPEFFHYFIVVQHFQRFAAGGFNNVQPFWFYPAVLLLASLPWLPWLVGNRLAMSPPPALSSAQERAVALLMVCWLLVVVLFFSIPASKLLGYILPAVPPLAALMARGFVRWKFDLKRKNAGWWFSIGATAVLNLCVVVLVAIKQPDSLLGLGRILATRHVPGEPVIMLGKFYYDLPFYARLPQAVAVVEDWKQAALRPQDDWRMELSDAAGFAPNRGADTLMMPADLSAGLCSVASSWIVGPVTAVGTYPMLRLMSVVGAQRDVRLWKVETSRPEVFKALGCAGHLVDLRSNSV